MKAAIYRRYGSLDVLRIEEIAKPTPGHQEVLIKINATSLNLSDCEMITGSPLYARIWGLFKPRFQTPGSDIAGIIEAVGDSVQRLKPGDEVFGDIMGHFGGFAEYVCVPEKTLHIKPAGLSFEEAAAVPQAGVIALQGIRDAGKAGPGRKILINGAGGGSGMFAIQLAKSLGAEVTGVDNSEKLDFMTSIGADSVVDYRKQDFTRTGKEYDFILDLVAHRSIFDHKRALAQGGGYRMVGGAVKRMLQCLLVGPLIALFGNKSIGILAVDPKREDIADLLDLFDAGKMRVIIDRCFPLSEVANALRYVAEGHALGKVVIKM